MATTTTKLGLLYPLPRDEQVFEGVHTWLRLRALRDDVLSVRIGGHDIGELGERPMVALARMLRPQGEVELFIDAREALGPSQDVRT
jgi:hypothetical protein